MRVAVFNAKPYDRIHLDQANSLGRHELTYFDVHLQPSTAVLAAGCEAVCAFVNDDLSRPVLEALANLGVGLVALRCAGFNNVDLAAANELGIVVARVPAYSPHAVAEHAVALILALNRKLPRAYARVRDGNFSLDGLCGFDVFEKTVGVVGTGTIGRVFASIMKGFGCRVVAFDPRPHPDCERQGVRYLSFDELLTESDIVSLHCPLSPKTVHLIDRSALSKMKPGSMLINTGRGALVDARALIDALKQHHLGALGMDVYEEEESLFFEDHSADIIDDDVFMRLLTFPNVLITAHQGFLTTEALTNIAQVTLTNISAFGEGALERCQVVT